MSGIMMEGYKTL